MSQQAHKKPRVSSSLIPMVADLLRYHRFSGPGRIIQDIQCDISDMSRRLRDIEIARNQDMMEAYSEIRNHIDSNKAALEVLSCSLFVYTLALRKGNSYNSILHIDSMIIMLYQCLTTYI